MLYHGIAIAGANGSGKSTLGKYMADLLQYRHMDAEDYYFRESAIPYENSRTKEEVQKLLYADIKKYGQFIVSAVNCDFGEKINRLYDFVVFIDVPLEIRLERVKQRSLRQFGSRILPGGDLYEQEQRFFSFVASRTMEKTEAWLERVKCPVIHIDGTRPIAENARLIMDRSEIRGQV